MWRGAFGVPETVSDTGPILHLHEIGRLPLLAPFSPLAIPNLVQTELDLYDIFAAELARSGIELTVIPVAEPIWKEILGFPGFSRIHVLQRSCHWPLPSSLIVPQRAVSIPGPVTAWGSVADQATSRGASSSARTWQSMRRAEVLRNRPQARRIREKRG